MMNFYFSKKINQKVELYMKSMTYKSDFKNVLKRFLVNYIKNYK